MVLVQVEAIFASVYERKRPVLSHRGVMGHGRTLQNRDRSSVTPQCLQFLSTWREVALAEKWPDGNESRQASRLLARQ